MGYFLRWSIFWGGHKIPQIVTLTPPLEEMGYSTKKVRRNDEPFLLFLLDLNQGPSD